MDVAVFPPCSLASGDNGDLFQRTYASMPRTQLPGLLKSVLLTPWQATVDPRLQQKLLETHGQICLSLLWGHCSFLLGPGVHKFLFVPSKSLCPQSCVSSGGSIVALMVTSSKRSFLVAQTVKHLPTMRETQV